MLSFNLWSVHVLWVLHVQENTTRNESPVLTMEPVANLNTPVCFFSSAHYKLSLSIGAQNLHLCICFCAQFGIPWFFFFASPPPNFFYCGKIHMTWNLHLDHFEVYISVELNILNMFTVLCSRPHHHLHNAFHLVSLKFQPLNTNSAFSLPQPISLSSLWFWFLEVFHKTEIIQCLFSCDWFISIRSSMFIHVVACCRIFFRKSE